MENGSKKQGPSVVAFYNPNGFVPAYKQAMAFAGKEGRVATLPDIIEARLATKLGESPWETYFTTMSAEYVGLSKAGNPIAIVAHGIGPMATLDGVLAAYSHEFKDKERNNRGGRISQEEFLKLEGGHYGNVHIVDIVATWNRRPYQFSGHAVTAKEITEEPLWQARLGKSWCEYIEYHTACAQKWHLDRAGVDPENTYGFPNHAEYCDRRRAMHLRLAKTGSKPSVLAMDCASNCSYFGRRIFDHWMKATPGTAIAHLISIGGLVNSQHSYHEYDYNQSEQREGLTSDVDCHEWSNGTRLVGVQGSAIHGIHPGLPSYDSLIEKHLGDLLRPNPNGPPSEQGFYHLVERGGKHFTELRKKGDTMDTGEPEYLVTKMIRVQKGRRTFRTTVGGYHGFFKYGLKEVVRIAPREANAYMLGEPKIESHDGDPSHHVAPITFYYIEVDTSRRLVRKEDIYRDFNLMMSLID